MEPWEVCARGSEAKGGAKTRVALEDSRLVWYAGFMQTLSRLRDKALIWFFNYREDVRAASIGSPLRFDESEAPLAPRSPRLTGKYAKFDLRGGPTQRQIRENDLPRYEQHS